MYKNEMTWRIRVYGIVQGVGFRPTVAAMRQTMEFTELFAIKGPMWKFMHRGQKEQIEGFFKQSERTSTEACGCFEDKYREYHRRYNRTV